MTTAPLAFTAAQVSVAQQKARQVTVKEPKFGLGFRFAVDVPNLSLGDWQSCAGLQVSYKPAEYFPGGNYLTRTLLPDRASFTTVKLTRAIEYDASAKLQKWLKGAAQDWFSDVRDATSNATIMLFDAHGMPVLQWVLVNVRPVAWSGPNLDASASKIAMETLELAHEGLHVLSPTASATGLNGDASKNSLTISGPGGSVRFLVPPEKINVVHNGESKQSRTFVNDGTTGEAGKPGVTQYKLNNLVLAGPTTATDVEKLYAWARRVPQDTDNQEPQSAYIKAAWGKAFPQDAEFQISSVGTDYTRFKSDGTPLRALVTLTLNVKAPDGGKGSQNPTSGGIPGRASHVVDATDSLAMLARTHYGMESGWRDIADANGMDDPLRLRPGQTLYLPARAELGEGGQH
jgi:phage tail-like protein